MLILPCLIPLILNGPIVKVLEIGAAKILNLSFRSVILEEVHLDFHKQSLYMLGYHVLLQFDSKTTST